ncbi:MAG: GGDEF domain-containing protein [Nitrospirae bacterium]|nr:MAG: GGDEF domain-containing protein [Nitrospirota bacterium]
MAPSLVDTILQITAADSLTELRQTFPEAVRSATGAVAARLFLVVEAVPGGPRELYPLPEGGSLPLTALPGAAEAVAGGERRVVAAAGGGHLTVQPLAEVAGEPHLLVLRHPTPRLPREAALDPLTTLFHHQTSLLRHLEHDALTGLRNRQSFDRELWPLLQAPGGRRRGDPDTLTLAMVDIDHFKRINDTHGHLVGDEVLILFARLMRATFRRTDPVYRYGGEEFCVVLPGAPWPAAERVMERFRAAVEANPFPQVGRCTASVGCAEAHPGEPPHTLVDRADRALYYAKANGRNQVRCHERLVAEGLLEAEAVAAGEVELF